MSLPRTEQQRVGTHGEDVVSELSWFHAADEAQQEVHHGRHVHVLQHQRYKSLLLPQEADRLQDKMALTKRRVKSQSRDDN